MCLNAIYITSVSHFSMGNMHALCLHDFKNPYTNTYIHSLTIGFARNIKYFLQNVQKYDWHTVLL
jgi:hypothetical protein